MQFIIKRMRNKKINLRKYNKNKNDNIHKNEVQDIRLSDEY